MNQRQVRMTLDMAMVILLPLLMAYSLVGELFHEVAGSGMLLLFLGHHLLNRGWWRNRFGEKGKEARNASGTGAAFVDRFRLAVDLLLVVFMISQPLSGILMSKHLYTFLHVSGAAAWARAVHLVGAYWGFVLLSIHAGTHMTAMLKRNRVIPDLWAAVALYGLVAFVRRGFVGYMLYQTPFVFFDFAESRVFFFLDYLSVMALFAMVGALIVWVGSRPKPSANATGEM